MNEQKQTWGNYFKSLSMIYLALLVGQVLAGGVIIYITSANNISEGSDLRDVFVFLVPAVVLSALLAGNFIYKMQLTRIKTYDLISKLKTYRGIAIIRFAFLESAYMFSIIVYLLTNDLLFLMAGGFVLLYFILLRPSIDAIAVDLELTANEKLTIKEPNERMI